ncbi:CD1375 family protein [Sporosarcina koreensis]|nr:CD1375 family protein [Sporosarcina koreensis]
MAIATIYVTLILDGYKTFSQVPTHIKPEVKRQLEQLGYPELAQ